MATTSIKHPAYSPSANSMMVIWLLGAFIASFIGAMIIVFMCSMPNRFIDNGVFSQPSFRLMEPLIRTKPNTDLLGLT